MAESFQAWLGVAILIGLLAILIASLKRSAAQVDAGREDLKPWKGGVACLFLAFLALLVFMAFQNLVLLIVILVSTGARLYGMGGVGLLARYTLPALFSVLFYSAAIWLLVWKRKPWVPKAAIVLLWLAGPVVSIPAYALYGMQPGPADFAIPSGVALVGTLYLFLSKRVRTVYGLPMPGWRK